MMDASQVGDDGGVFEPAELRVVENSLTVNFNALGGWHEIDGLNRYVYGSEQACKALDSIYDLLDRYPLGRKRQILKIVSTVSI